MRYHDTLAELWFASEEVAQVNGFIRRLTACTRISIRPRITVTIFAASTVVSLPDGSALLRHQPPDSPAAL